MTTAKNQETATPRCDEMLWGCHIGSGEYAPVVPIDFARALERELAAANARAEKAERERDAIAELNHGQFLELTYLRRIHGAAHNLYTESEEYDFPDGLGKGAPQDLWDALADAFEPETEAIAQEVAALALETKHA